MSDTPLADELFDRSKDDRAMIVGSEIRAALRELRQRAEAAESETTQWKLLADDRWAQCQHESKMRDEAEAEVERQRALLIALQQHDPEAFCWVCQRPEFAWCREDG